jgi:anti-anti-sigma factor
VFELVGEFDMANAADLELAFNEAVADGCGIVADLSNTDYIDSSIVRTLYNTHQELETRGRRLVLRINTASVVLRMLEISNLTSVLPTTDDPDAAARLAAGSTAGGRGS